MDFGHAIRRLRKEHDMTQGQLAELCFVSKTTVSAWENDRTFPPKGSAERLCKAFGIPVAYFILEGIEEQDVPEKHRDVFLTLLKPMRNFLLEKEP